MKRIIFLNVDGVLNHIRSHCEFENSCIKTLAHIVKYSKGAKIILIDEYGENGIDQDLLEKFKEYGLKVFASCYDKNKSEGERVDSYLTKIKGKCRYVILDCISKSTYSNKKRYVKTNKFPERWNCNYGGLCILQIYDCVKLLTNSSIRAFLAEVSKKIYP